MSYRLAKTAALAAVVSFGITACSNTDVPSGPGEGAFDAAQTQAELQRVDAAFDTPAFQSLAVLGEQFGSSAGAAAAASAALLYEAGPTHGSSLAERAKAAGDRLAQAYASASASMAPIIPADWLGRTYVYDPETEGYVHNPELTGAPEDGIRFVLYAVNPVTHDIIVDSDIGYADVRDVGGANSTAVRLTVVSEEVTYLDYTITATGVFNAPVFDISGFITDGEQQVDFTLVHSILATIGSVQVGIDYDITTSEDFGVTVDVTLTSSGQTSSVEVNVTLTHGPNTVVLEGSVVDGSGSLTVTGNGEVFAIIELGPGSITVTDADGNPISQETHQALERIWQVVDDVFDVFEDLFDPIEWLFNFSG